MNFGTFAVRLPCASVLFDVLNRKKAALPALYASIGALHVAKDVADGVLDACEDVVKGADYITTKGLIPLAEDALAAAQKAGDAAFATAQGALKVADKVTGEALMLVQKTLDEVKKGGDSVFRAAESAMNQFIEVQKAVLDAAQKAIDDLVKSVEWLAYQVASGALDVAKHATAAVDMAEKALSAVQSDVDAVSNISEDVIDNLENIFDIKKIELDGTLTGLLGQSDQHFTALIKGKVASGSFKFKNVSLNLNSIGDFIHDIFKEYV